MKTQAAQIDCTHEKPEFRDKGPLLDSVFNRRAVLVNDHLASSLAVAKSGFVDLIEFRGPLNPD